MLSINCLILKVLKLESMHVYLSSVTSRPLKGRFNVVRNTCEARLLPSSVPPEVEAIKASPLDSKTFSNSCKLAGNKLDCKYSGSVPVVVPSSPLRNT